ncbi:MAG: response regulator [Acidobacteriota bacterium]|nr:response regulator [Acidobacteriota bacterium]
MHEIPAASRPKVLLIDDDELIAGALRSYLCGAGCDVDVASDSASAEGLMARREYTKVIVDPYLTAATGIDRLALLDTVRVMQPSASLIVVTAYATPAITDSVTAGRIHSLLIKPRPLSELGHAVIPDSLRSSNHPPVEGPAE